MSGRRLQLDRLRRDLEGFQGERPYTPLYSLLTILGRQESGLVAESTVAAEVARTNKELEETLEALDQMDSDHPACDVFGEALDILEDFSDGDAARFRADLESVESRFLGLDLEGLGRGAELYHYRLKLQKILEQKVEEKDLVTGHYLELEGAVGDWLEGDMDANKVLALLGRHRQRVESAHQAYESSYFEAGEWTVAVALADDLLQSGYRGWLEGLKMLEAGLVEGKDVEVEEGLARLLNGNFHFVQVSRLNRQLN